MMPPVSTRSHEPIPARLSLLKAEFPDTNFHADTTQKTQHNIL